MRKGWSSLTALLVTFGRSVGTADAALGSVCRDDMAQALLPEPLRELARLLPGPLAGFVRRASLGLFDHVALRTGLIDAALESAVRAGARQLVILGAGFDTRAHRLACLRECSVYEVDHPATQALKLARSSGLPLRAAALRHVACDFHEGELRAVLRAAGFDPSLPSVWIWEGVTVYLRDAAVRGTLATVAELSPPGSTLISTYVRPELARGGALWARLANAALAGVAEPVHFVSTADGYRVLLAEYGFALHSDRTPEAYALEQGVKLLRLRVGMPEESVTVARRQ